ncbi:nitrogenase stabilizing/protective protein NifW [Bradyrhizobium sp. dw_78]|uniref:nitrogenase stabilizing/protective protein NifW n=1 Tax=Bradyrhizobium sp. dw_78 TaxID=2719793 RepID=UPI001BD51E6B|nr:nitrogenase stabilizing/protective protein NifW [Bradyrhizobium sp. dw_78]
MSGAPTSANTPGGVLDQMHRASAAEDFFTLLGVDYDPNVVNVVRLHILRRMGQYLVSEDFSGLPDAVVAERCKAVLEQAYADFVASSPLDQRVFKVLKDAVAPAKPRNIVPLSTLK